MSTQQANDNIGDQLERLYADWREANARAAAAIREVRANRELSGLRHAALERAEARAASIVARYWELAAPHVRGTVRLDLAAPSPPAKPGIELAL